jgi:hypothetical protein
MIDLLHLLAYSVVGLVWLTLVGNLVCKLVLTWTGLSAALATRASATPVAEAASEAPRIRSNPRVGRAIGAVERVLMALAILAGAWEVLAAVIALKSVARFKELDERLDAEYFLVGSLFSLLWAIVTTVLWTSYDTAFGVDVTGMIFGPGR